MISDVTNSIIYVGANDHDLDLFEGQYIVPNGMAYNSYVIKDEKSIVIDTIDQSKTEEWLANLEEALEGSVPDYLLVQHMEPDHSASIEAFLGKYPETTVIGNAKTFKMIGLYFPELTIKNTLEVNEGDTLTLGSHTLTFIMAPMVHWPEVMMTYESSEKILFSADGFGKFGALDVDEDWACEARRYYIGIVGRFGAQVQAVLKKAAALDIQIICPLHGPVLTENLGYYIDLYDTWSSYRPEDKGVCICYTSVYGHTKAAALALHDRLVELGVEIVEISDLARCDMAEAVEDAFRYDTLVLATTTYNGDIFPFMNQFIDHLVERFYQNRNVALIENGSWGPTAKRVMTKKLENCKNLNMLENSVTIKAALNDDSRAQIESLAQEIAALYA
ncbi:MAG: FprA family A-type flavoprotein [Firmicutes bacterium]|nr:FprA family A-type flavoprotein [Bacillota bacterium]